jgi:hypothetical protein
MVLSNGAVDADRRLGEVLDRGGAIGRHRCGRKAFTS